MFSPQLDHGMGWKNCTVLVRPAPSETPDTILADLGFAVRRDIGRHPYNISMGPGSIWVGVISDCLVLETDFAPFLWEDCPGSDEDYLKNGARFKDSLLRNFSDAEIIALMSESVTGSGAFAVYRKGKLVRRWFSLEGIVEINEGAELAEENATLSNYEPVEIDGETAYLNRKHPEYGPQPMGALYEELVFKIFHSTTGYNFDAQEVSNVVGSRFWLNDDEQKYGRREIETRSAKKPKNKSWWKFWN
jgi:hypothetical protein